MFERLKEHPVFMIIGAFIGLAGVVIGVLSLIEPVYMWVTDGKVCGFYSETESKQKYEWNECANPNKIIGYQYTEIVTKSSGWVSGGRDQNWHCTNVKREKERAVGQSIVWSKPNSSERVRKDLLGHVTYNYNCSIEAKWGPIFQVERWPGCGKAKSISVSVTKESSCFDLSKRVGWKWKWQ